jgi:hypothetical protein
MQTIDFLQLKDKVAQALKTGRHPFEELEAYQHPVKPDQAFIDKWAKPFYMKVLNLEEPKLQQLERLVPEITDEVILTCLGDYNWRTRRMGAYFAAIKNKTDFIDIIGTHLIKRELCCVGATYALVLAAFNNERGNQYLEIHLDYYLNRTDRDFDQGPVLTAIKYLDEVNGTSVFEKYREKWEQFLADKENLKAEVSIDFFKERIETIKRLRAGWIT